jgi:hypothetical protein
MPIVVNMERMHIAFVMLALLVFSFGCTGLSDDAQSLIGDGRSTAIAGETGAPGGGAVSVYKSAPSAPGSTDLTGTAVQDQMIIKTGTAEINVPEGKIAERYAALQTMAKQYGGDMESSSYSESDSGKTQYVTIRINSSAFDTFTGRLGEIGTVKKFSSNSEDVTQQYIDISAKLQNLVASRDRLLALYNTTANLSDIIMLEREIADVQYQIDSTTQQKLYYERQSAKATVSVTLSEPLPVVDKSLLDPFSQLANIFIESLAAGVTLVVIAAGFLLPLAAVAFALWKTAAWLISKLRKK